MKKFIIAAACTAFLTLVSGCSKKDAVVHKDVEFQSNTGLTIRGYLEGPESAIYLNKKCPLIILMHGLMDSNEFDLIRKQADAYKEKGFAVLAMDFNGHGKSDGTIEQMTIPKELQDGQAIIEYAKNLQFPSEIILTGHSQGGVIASTIAANNSEVIDKLVLLAPGGMISDNLRSGKCFGQDFDTANPPEKMPVFDSFVGRDYIVTAMALDPYQMAKGYKDHSVLLIEGGADPLVSGEVIEKYRKIYSQSDYNNSVTVKTIADAPHDFAGFENQLTESVLEFLK